MLFSAKKQRRQQLLAEPFPEAWLEFLRENMLLYRTLSEVEQAQLQDAVRIFVAEKYWEGCRGLEITEEMQVTIAGQACLLVLGFEDYYFDELRTVLVYPGGFLAQDPYGRTDRSDPLVGEAHHKGPVILSWWHVLWDGRRPGSRNLVLHEFAHKLAELGEPNDGMPAIDDPDLRHRWQEVTETEYAQLCEDIDRGQATLLDPYGATNRAEFFAVATECFFARPRALRRRHRELYELLSEWYGQDPAGRQQSRNEDLAKEPRTEREYIDHHIEELSAAIRQRPDSVDAYSKRARWYYYRGDLDRALADYHEVLRRAPENAETYCDRGTVYQAKGCYEEALADFDRAIRIWPDYGRAYRLRASAFAAQGDFAKAVANFTRVLDSDPEDAEAYRERALAYAAMGEEDKAQRDRASAERFGRISKRK